MLTRFQQKFDPQIHPFCSLAYHISSVFFVEISIQLNKDTFLQA